MDKKEISSIGQGEDKPATKKVEASQSNEARNRARAKRKKRSRITPQVKLLIAFITAITPITVAWFSFKSSHPEPAPIPIVAPITILSPTPSFTDIPGVPTDMPAATTLPPLTFTPNITVLPTGAVTIEPSSVPKLIVLLVANKTSGKAPLKVKFDARESYLTDYGGQTYVCHNGACYYTWKVYSGGQQTGKSVTDSGGTFDYTFGKQGTYMVTVWICRGKDGVDCGGSGAQIIVTK